MGWGRSWVEIGDRLRSFTKSWDQQWKLSPEEPGDNLLLPAKAATSQTIAPVC